MTCESCSLPSPLANGQRLGDFVNGEEDGTVTLEDGYVLKSLRGVVKHVGDTVGERTTAVESELESHDDRLDILEAAALLGLDPYDTPADGIAATSEGDLFITPGVADDSAIDIYLHDTGGVATLRRSFASLDAVTSLQAVTAQLGIDIPKMVPTVTIDARVAQPLVTDLSGRVALAVFMDTGEVWLSSTAKALIFDVDAGPSVFPLVSDLRGAALLYADKRSQRLHGPVAAGQRPPLVARTGYASSELTERVHLLGYGQSPSVGAGQSTVLTTTALYSGTVLTFGAGPKAGETENTGTDTEKDLVEDSASGDVNGAIRGETFVSGAAYEFVERRSMATGTAPGDRIVFGSTAGYSGQSIAQLSKGNASGYYNRPIFHVEEAKALAATASDTYSVGAVCYLGNEADTASNDYAYYLAALGTLHADLVADIKTETGQSYDPVFIMVQVNWAGQTTADHVPLAQLAFEDGETRFLAAPSYPFAYAADEIHYTAVGHHIAGRHIGRVAEAVLERGLSWRGLRLTSAWTRDRQTIVCQFDVPSGQVVIDRNSLGAITDDGFQVALDGGGTATINDVYPLDWDKIAIELSTPLTVAATLRYALDYNPVGTGIASDSGGGCIRDTDPETVVVAGQTHPLWNWLPACSVPVIQMGA